MKKLLLLFCFGLLASFANAQVSVLMDNHKNYTWSADTIGNGTGADSIVYFTLPYEIGRRYNYTCQIVTDSISGGAQGTVYMQQSAAAVGSVYTNVTSKTHAINGAGQTSTLLTGTIDGGRLRFKAEKDTGVQKVRVRIWLTLDAAMKY